MVPPEITETLFKTWHYDRMHGHAGALKILTELRKKFSTSSLAIEVHFVTNCQTCLKAKPDKIIHGYRNYHRKNGFKNTTTFSNTKNYTDAGPLATFTKLDG